MPFGFSLPYCTSGNGRFYFKKLSVLYGFIGNTMADSEKRQHTTREEEEEEEDDPVIRAIQKTGCLELHYALQECMAERQDWRKCQDSMLNFKNCMNDYARKQTPRQWRLCSLGVFFSLLFSLLPDKWPLPWYLWKAAEKTWKNTFITNGVHSWRENEGKDWKKLKKRKQNRAHTGGQQLIDWLNKFNRSHLPVRPPASPAQISPHPPVAGVSPRLYR